ncbi:MAG: IMPACT family protein [Eubacteriales bacterium]|nr:IMPACT family protein [Eubacteriales bacterium]
MKAYKTLLRDAEDEYVIQKSRFISHAAPVQTEETALAFIAAVRQQHKAASHNCYAYIVGHNAGVMRYSDDGEPGGTAGLPMIEMLKARCLVDCAVVVTRYFGGILLGAGGLARAYGHSCALALAAAGECEMVPSFRWELQVGYPFWDKVQYAFKNLPVRPEPPVYATDVRFTLLCRQTDADAVWMELKRVTDGRVRRLAETEQYAPWETGEREA